MHMEARDIQWDSALSFPGIELESLGLENNLSLFLPSHLACPILWLLSSSIQSTTILICGGFRTGRETRDYSYFIDAETEV